MSDDKKSGSRGATREASEEQAGEKQTGSSGQQTDEASKQDKPLDTSSDNDNDTNSQASGNDSDADVIKVARTTTSPALRTQLQHSEYYHQAHGSGAGGTGAAIWRVQRMTALALIPLAIWFAVVMVRLSQGSQAAAAAWLAYPVHAALMALFIVIALRHAVIGCQIVLEDYVPAHAWRTAWVLLVKAAAVALGSGSVAALIWLVAQ